MVRAANLGFVELREAGITIMFKETPVSNLNEHLVSLRVSAIHLHRQGHDAYAQYSGQLPGYIAFDDREEKLLRKMGVPAGSGGGGRFFLLRKPIARWIRYLLENDLLHLQLDARGRLEMVTLYAQEMHPNLT